MMPLDLLLYYNSTINHDKSLRNDAIDGSPPVHKKCDGQTFGYFLRVPAADKIQHAASVTLKGETEGDQQWRPLLGWQRFLSFRTIIS